MKQVSAICTGCPLWGRGYVEGVGSTTPGGLLLLGQCPGPDESFRSHRPFTGPAGKELDRFLRYAHVDRETSWVTNLVKCNPPDDRDPTPEEIERCSYYLKRELNTLDPSVVVTLGAIPLHYFMPQLDLDMVQGIPQGGMFPPVIFPLIHPARGLHQPRILPLLLDGFKRLGDWLGGTPVWEGDTIPDPIYFRAQVAPEARTYLADYGVFGVDTETTWDRRPLYIQVCDSVGGAMLVEHPDHVAEIKGVLENEESLTILHNAMFDLDVLHRMGITPSRVVDTMVMAYILQDLPLGLKALAHRLCGMEMRSYKDIIRDAEQEKALGYLLEVMSREWPNPPHELTFKEDGSPHVRKPQNIARKVSRAISTPGADLRKRWHDMDGKEEVELALGPMPGADLRDVPQEVSTHYACKDADATRRIYPVLKRRIKEEGLEGVLDMDMGIIPMVLDMQRNGITVDLPKLRELDTYFLAQMGGIERELQALTGVAFNPNSTPQVLEVLSHMGVPLKKYKGKDSAGVFVLEPLRAKYPVCGKVLDWRKYETLRTMFINPLSQAVRKDGKVHTHISITRTVTGRLATNDPNLMAQPVRDKEGKLIRECFVASPGWVLASYDYSQIEMRIAAHGAQDPAMLRVFREGLDIHSETAAGMFHIPVDQVDSDKHRYPAKRVGFGILYGITAVGLLAQMETQGASGWSQGACEGWIRDWLALYKGIADWMEENKAHARRTGEVRDLWGRKRLVHGVWSTSRKVAADTLREAMNAPVQMGAQGVIKIAMGRVWREVVLPLHELVRPLLQIHDDILLTVREDVVSWIIPMVQDIMENAVKLSIPTPVDVKTGVRWGSMEKWKS